MIQFGTHEDLKKSLGNKSMFGKDDCPFCRDIRENEGVLWKGDYWAVIYNKYPYILNGKHIMLVPINHVSYSCNLSNEEGGEYGEAQNFIKKYFQDGPYFSFTRETMAERSVEHLHIHFISGKINRESFVEILKIQGYNSLD